jgi:DNA primase
VSSDNGIKRLLNKAFGTGTISRDGINYAIKCFICNDSRAGKKKLIVRLDDGRYHCWVCGAKGTNVLRLIARFRPDLVEGIKGIEYKMPLGTRSEERIKLSLPKGTVVLGLKGKTSDPDLKAAYKYLTKRGFSRKDMLRWRLMSCSTGSFRRRVIVPSFDSEGNLNYYVARTIDSAKKMKYRNADVSKEEVIFNEVDLDWEKEIILVEGVFDAMKCPENTVPVLGSSLSKKSNLLKMITRYQTPCLVSLDPDMKHKAYKLADLLVSSGCTVRVSFAPHGRDLGELSKEEVSSLISDAIPYNDMMRITHKISEIKSGSLF